MQNAVNTIGRSLISIGVILVIVGVVLIFAARTPYIGKLPGDIYIKKKNFTFYFPITTSILISIILSVLLFLFTKKR